jgi:FkbM family methyltransferase
MDSVDVLGLSVPQTEEKRFASCREFEGLPDLDVSKVSKCVNLGSRFETALDIGAHIGAVSVYLARRFRKVVAFEAVPATFAFLERNTASLDNVTALNAAAGPEAGEVFFSHYPSHGQLSHVTHRPDEEKTIRIGPVPVRTIDSFDFPEVSFIKIDVEGYELPVLQGAEQTIRRCRPLILVEQGGNEEKHFGRPRDEASAFLESLGMHRHPEEPRMSKDRLYTF